MPKKRKQPRKPHRRGASSAGLTATPPPGWDPGPMLQTGVSRGLGQAKDEDWERLRSEFLAVQPGCPDCGSEWFLEGANEEEGVTFAGAEVISISVVCSKWNEDDDAGREPAPHPISDGFGDHQLQLA